ncbi:MAG: undecaprenyl-diphosphate phosphatase [Pirellulales bacterium]
MDYLSVIVLAMVQGITEFLPISSDGHLVIAEGLLRSLAGQTIPEGLQLTIVLHAGTLLSIVVVFWGRIWRLLGADRRVIGLLIVATIPVVLVGLPLRKYAEEPLKSTLLTGILLPINGLILLWAARRQGGTADYPQLTHRQALWIGMAQSLAPLPGISRSCTTIAAGLGNGLRRDAAATFSFLMALPAVGGACLNELIEYFREGSGPAVPWQQLLVGAIVSFLVGVLALKWLLHWLQAGRLHWFGWWCIGIGIAVVAWQLAA